MIEELVEYLIRYGWQDEAAQAIAHAYSVGSPSRKAALAIVKWMDDETHDYSGELDDCITQWRWEAGEDEYPKMRQLKRESRATRERSSISP